MNSFDFALTPAPKKGTPRKGRRAGVSGVSETDLPEDLPVSPILSPVKSSSKPPASSRPNRRSGGWAASASTGGFGPPSEEDQRFNTIDDKDTDIPEIPDLDEVYEEDFTQQIAQAPNIQVNRVATFKELDTDLLRHAAFSTLDDIDLRLLTSALYNETEVREPDVEWRWDPLFTEVTSELINETEDDDTESTKEQEPPNNP